MKRFITFICIFCMLLSISVTALATTMTVNVDATTLDTEKHITVIVSLDGKVEEATVFQGELYYDSTLLSVVEMTSCEEPVFTMVDSTKSSCIKFSAIDPTSQGLTLDEGVLVSITFFVAEDADIETIKKSIALEVHLQDALGNNINTVTVESSIDIVDEKVTYGEPDELSGQEEPAKSEVSENETVYDEEIVDLKPEDEMFEQPGDEAQLSGVRMKIMIVIVVMIIICAIIYPFISSKRRRSKHE